MQINVKYSNPQGGRRGRRYKSITLGYEEGGRMFTPYRQPPKRSRTEAATAAPSNQEDEPTPADKQPPVKKYVVHKKKTSRRIQ